MKSSKKATHVVVRAIAATIVSTWAVNFEVSQAGVGLNTAGPVAQGTSDGSSNFANNNPAVTISFSGQTALRNFDTSQAITELQPGTSIVLHDGTNGAAVTYNSPNNSSTNVQLASSNFTLADKWKDQDGNVTTVGSTVTGENVIQNNSAIRLEWHEQGSIDGFYDLINDEIGYPTTAGQATALGTGQAVGPISVLAQRTPSSSNPTWINTNKFTNNTPAGGQTLDTSGLDATALNDTYNTNVYNQATGQNKLGGQNRIQFAVGENPIEGFSVNGTPSPFATTGSAGYGKGNPALASATTLTGLGVGGVRQQFQSTSIANLSTAINNPTTGSSYTTGPWNSAGAANFTSTSIAATAVTYSANPGTGLQRIDKGDAQWLQTTGRLQNGALFNVVARTVDTGQRAVFALNSGVDPSWAGGSNDDGNSTSSTAALAQHSIGSSLRYDGKTSGSEAAATIGNSRLAVGALSIPEARAVSTGIVRALPVDFTNQLNLNPNSTSFVAANFDTIASDGVNPIQDGGPNNGQVVPHYAAVLISHYNTVKTPNATALLAQEKLDGFISNADNNAADATNVSIVPFAQQLSSWAKVQSFDPATAETDSTPATAPISGIKGDTTGDVAAFISNIVNSEATATSAVATTSANNPADGLLSIGFLPPALLDYTRDTDGGALTSVTLNANALSKQQSAYSNYHVFFTTDNSTGASNNTIGSTGSFYGSTTASSPSSNGVAINVAIPITAKVNATTAAGNGTIAPGGNYLFGNFNQNGVRDYSAVQEAVNAAISLYNVDGATNSNGIGKNSIFTPDGGVANNVAITTSATPGDTNPGWLAFGTNTKGDLITLGDFNGDGKFDGADLYLLAIGQSLADSASSNTLTATATTYADVLRDPTKVLRKNSALNYITQQLGQSFANIVPTGNTITPAAFLRTTGRSILTVPGVTTAAGVPAGSTALNTTDPVTGLEQFTYDASGAFAFDKHDVNRDGVVDFNDAILVDQYNGQSYTNLTQSLAATQQTPVTGTAEQVSLVAVQQIDGEASIGAADLTELNTGLTGTSNTNWYGYTLQKTGAGTINYARTGGTVHVYSGASLQINGGSVNVGKDNTLTAVAGAVDPFTDSSATGLDVTKSVAVSVASGSLDYAARTGTSGDTGIKVYRLNSLTVQNGGTVKLDSPAASANHSVLVTGSLSILDTSTVDLGANDLIVRNATASVIATKLAAGFNAANHGYWNGTGGIVSTAAANDTRFLTTLGYRQSDGTSFDGQTPSTTDVLVKYTYYGDATLDGTVNGSDYQQIDNGFGNGLTGWSNGDFNYDGVVNGSDFALIDNTFNQITATGAAPLSLVGSAVVADLVASPAGSVAAVPEPSGLALIGISAVGLLRKRRRRD